MFSTIDGVVAYVPAITVATCPLHTRVQIRAYGSV